MSVVSMSSIFDQQAWSRRLPELHDAYVHADPFPHIVLDDFLNPAGLDQVVEDVQHFAADGWINYAHINERKRGFNKLDELPPHVQALIRELNAPDTVSFLSALTGIPDLLPDMALEGGGLHESRRGGFLNIHADFVSHPHRPRWRRRVNVLVYLNKRWHSEWGGQLELWDRQMTRCVRKVEPMFNRCVIFNTDETSFHGHPDPMTCPADEGRRSIALYYFTEEPEAIKLRSTHYRARPQDAGRKWLIHLDNFLIRVYTWTKRRAGASDRLISAVLKVFARTKRPR
jgi:hypothetical protein